MINKPQIRAEQHCKAVLEKELKFAVKQIPTSQVPEQRTADYLTSDEDGNDYLVEVTTKNDDNDFSKDLRHGGVVLRSSFLRRKEKFVSILRDKTEQLTLTNTARPTHNILWLYLLGSDTKAQMGQCEATFLGRADIGIRADGGKKTEVIPCYFFDYADCYKKRDLDGIVLSTFEKGKLLVNSFSNRIDIFRTTKFYSFFQKSGAVIDPVQNQKDNNYFVLDDFNLDRKNENTLLKALKEKYSVNGEILRFNWQSVVVATTIRPKSMRRSAN